MPSNEADAIQAASLALADEMEQAAKLATDTVEALLGLESHVDVVETKVAELYSGMLNALGTFSDQVRRRKERVREQSVDLKGELVDAETLVRKSVDAVGAASKELSDSLITITLHTGQLGEGVTTSKAQIQTDTAAFAAALTATGSAVQQVSAVSKQSLSSLESAAQQMMQEWQTFVGDLDNRMGDMINDLASEIDTNMSGDLKDYATAFSDALRAVDQDIFQKSLSELRNEIVDQIASKFTQLINEAIDAIVAKFDEVIGEILDTKDREELEEKMMRDLLDVLRPIFEQVDEQFNVVDSIASAVGVDLR